MYPSSLGGTMLKTQSLPACVRSKPRPLSNADDPAELYAKVIKPSKCILKHLIMKVSKTFVLFLE